MAKRAYIWLIAGLFLFILTQQVHSQDENWLQYHSARELNLVGFSSTSKSLTIIEKIPADVNMPKFTGESQIFAKWHTKMVDKGFLWIALDRSHKYGMYDILYIDSNQDYQ